MNTVFVYNKPNMLYLFGKKTCINFCFNIAPISFNTLNTFSMFAKWSWSVLPLIKMPSTLNHESGIFTAASSINLWNIPVAGLTPYDILVGCFKPWLVFVFKHFCDSSSSSTYKYASIKSVLENFSPLFIFKNNSSRVGCGYVSFLITRITVPLYSAHILMAPSGFGTMTIGISHLEYRTGFNMPSFHLINFCFNCFFQCKRYAFYFQEFRLWVCFIVYFSFETLNFS